MSGWSIVSRTRLPLGERTLCIGMRGYDVVELEKLLGFLGLYHGKEDGIYGDLLEEAVADLQRKLILPVDGTFSKSVCQCLTNRNEGGQWIVQNEESREGGVALRLVKKLWIWSEESRWFPNATGNLIRPGDRSWSEEKELDHYYPVLTIPDIQEQESSIRENQEWILDLRREKPCTIRECLKNLSRRSKAWLWLNDRMLSIFGTISYLGIQDDRKKAAGLIIEVNPDIRESADSSGWKRRSDLFKAIPIMISLNLRPRIVINNEEKQISHKEERIWQYRHEGEFKHSGCFRWANCLVRKNDQEGRLWLADQQTFAAFCQSILHNRRLGMVLEGLSGGDPRIVKIHQEYFALENIGHEMSIRDIYLKREKCLKTEKIGS